MDSSLTRLWGLLLVVCIAAVGGCTASIPSKDVGKTEHHDHADAGPHGGDLMALDGGAFHAEVLTDTDAGKTTIYILDKSAKETVFVLQQDVVMRLEIDGNARDFKLAAAPVSENAGEVTERFQADDAELVAALQTEAKEHAELTVTIQNKPRQGHFETHHDHDHAHDHDHDHHANDAPAKKVLVWHEEVQLHGNSIRLGQHGLVVHAGETVQPAVTIERDGTPVKDAQVTFSLLAEDAATVLASEQPASFEAADDDQAARYVSEALEVPDDVGQLIIRYQVTLPGGAGSETFDQRLRTERD